MHRIVEKKDGLDSAVGQTVRTNSAKKKQKKTTKKQTINVTIPYS